MEAMKRARPRFVKTGRHARDGRLPGLRPPLALARKRPLTLPSPACPGLRSGASGRGDFTAALHPACPAAIPSS